MTNEIIGFIAVIASNIGVFLWLRSESSSDRRELFSLINEMKNEFKYFHGRMCVLEERFLEMKKGK